MENVTVVPDRVALVNVDMQRCFVEGSPLASPDGLAVAERINRVSEACRSTGATVVHTRGMLRADGVNPGVAAELVPTFIRELYTEGSPTAEMHEAITVASGDIVFDKPRYGAFTATDLDLILRARGIDTVIVSGIATNVCCDTTAREAAQLGYRVFFLSDGTATKEMNGVSAEELQRATCATLGMVFAHILSVDAMVSELEASVREPLLSRS